MNVIIIGGTSGIGLSLAKHYLAKEADVWICGRDITKVPSALLQQYKSLSPCQLDVMHTDELSAFIDGFTQIDLFIYCAGFYFNERAIQLNNETSHRMLTTNLKGAELSFLHA